MKSRTKHELEADVTQYDLAKLRLGQALVPVTMMVGIGARHLENPAMWLAAIGLIAYSIFVLLKARRRLGAQTLVISQKAIRVGTTGMTIDRDCTARWFIDGQTARFYEPDVTWRITVPKANADQLHSHLSELFGKPPSLTRRGSVLARSIAFSAGLVGLAAMMIGWFYNADGLVVFGFLPAFIGFITTGVLFQKIAVRDQDGMVRFDPTP